MWSTVLIKRSDQCILHVVRVSQWVLILLAVHVSEDMNCTAVEPLDHQAVPYIGGIRAARTARNGGP
jgi:hypothetical protein